jgi:hypothetical protein
MDYYQHLSNIRNEIHREIVQEATVKNSVRGNKSDGVLLMEKPITIRDYIISSVCCETGYLISTDNDRIVPYQRLTVEELSVIHNCIVQAKQYSYISNKELV